MERRTYLDHNATTPLDPAVREAMARAADGAEGNPSSVHLEGRRARALLEDARERVAAVLGARAREIVFTSGATEALNLALGGSARARRTAGRRVVVTAIEHAAVLETAAHLESEGDTVVRVAPTRGGSVSASAFLEACTAGTTTAAMMLANHETGVCLPVTAVASALRARGVTTVCDAALGPGMLDVRVETLGVDLLALSAHKWNGPKGVGALYVRRRTRLEPLIRGGPQEDRVRGGTENVLGAVGMAVALERADGTRLERAARYAALCAQVVETLRSIEGCELLGRDEPRLPNTVSAAFPGCEGEALLVSLDLEGVAVSTGSACAVGGTEASPVLLAMGLVPKQAASSLRISVGEGTEARDVARWASVLPAVVARLRALAR